MNKSKALVAIKENNTILADNCINSFINFITVRAYTSGLKQFFAYLRIKGISQPDRNSVIEFKKYLSENNCKNSTIALYLSAIKKFFSWCENEGLYSNITVGVKAPKVDRGHKKDAFSGDQIKEVLKGINRNSLEGLRNYAILALITTAGLRTIEVTRANVEDIRLNAGQPVLYVQGKGKSSKADFVKLTPKVFTAIKNYLKARGEVKPTDALFCSHSKRNKGQRLTTRTISGVCKSAMITAGYISSRLTAHSLRHTAITLALIAGQSLQEVQAFARHSSMNTTLIYAHNVNRLNSNCECLIENAIF